MFDHKKKSKGAQRFTCDSVSLGTYSINPLAKAEGMTVVSKVILRALRRHSEIDTDYHYYSFHHVYFYYFFTP
jgi:hypothetical protein